MKLYCDKVIILVSYEVMAMRGIAIASQKGGVGKTTTAVNLAAYFAFVDKRVLVVDMDLQGNATTHLGIDKRQLDKTVYDVLRGEASLIDVIKPTRMENLEIAPANIGMRDIETELIKKSDRYIRLKKALTEIADKYDYAVIDTSPYVGIATKNALMAADTILIPIETIYFSLEGLRLTQELLDELDLNGVKKKYVLTMYSRSNSAKLVMKRVREAFGDDVAQTVIPKAVTLSTAPSFGLPVVKKYPRSAGALAYYKLALEALEW